MKRFPIWAAIVIAASAVWSCGDKACAEVLQPGFVLEWGTLGEGPGEFHSPIGVAFNSMEWHSTGRDSCTLLMRATSGL